MAHALCLAASFPALGFFSFFPFIVTCSATGFTGSDIFGAAFEAFLGGAGSLLLGAFIKSVSPFSCSVTVWLGRAWMSGNAASKLSLLLAEIWASSTDQS